MTNKMSLAQNTYYFLIRFRYICLYTYKERLHRFDPSNYRCFLYCILYKSKYILVAREKIFVIILTHPVSQESSLHVCMMTSISGEPDTSSTTHVLFVHSSTEIT